MTELNAATIRARLGLSDRCATWLDQVSMPAKPRQVQLPDDAAADALLARLGARLDARAACLAARPDPDAHPDLWWVLERAYQELVGAMARDAWDSGYSGWPSLPERTGSMGRQLYVWVFLAAMSDVRRYHKDRGIPDEVSWATLAGLGTEINAGDGLAGTWMHPLLFRGWSYRLGRHVFDRGNGDLNVHIPAGEPLDPAASQASFEWARQFFPRHFPDESVTGFTCHSWLLDDQWARYLPETSNIVRFQRRFTLLPDESEADSASGDADILTFVFHQTPESDGTSAALLDRLPQDTTLQQAFVRHLRAGGHWRTRTGRFDVQDL